MFYADTCQASSCLAGHVKFLSDPALYIRLVKVDSEGRISFGSARVSAVRLKFPSNKSFTFDIRYRDSDRILLSTVRG